MIRAAPAWSGIGSVKRFGAGRLHWLASCQIRGASDEAAGAPGGPDPGCGRGAAVPAAGGDRRAYQVDRPAEARQRRPAANPRGLFERAGRQSDRTLQAAIFGQVSGGSLLPRAPRPRLWDVAGPGGSDDRGPHRRRRRDRPDVRAAARQRAGSGRFPDRRVRARRRDHPRRQRLRAGARHARPPTAVQGGGGEGCRAGARRPPAVIAGRPARRRSGRQCPPGLSPRLGSDSCDRTAARRLAAPRRQPDRRRHPHR